jgi:hypothetical protein
LDQVREERFSEEPEGRPQPGGFFYGQQARRKASMDVAMVGDGLAKTAKSLFARFIEESSTKGGCAS